MDFVKRNFRYLFLAVLLAGVFLVWYAVFAEDRAGELTVDFLDVGQGDAILIDTPAGQQILIDGGPNKTVLRQLAEVMPFYDRSIDVVVETHPDSDHISGLVEVLKRYNVGLVLEPGVESGSSVSKEFEDAVKQKNIPEVLARRGMRLNLQDGVYLEILFPVGDVSGWDTNDACIVAKLVYGKSSFLFMGDSPQKIEKYLVSVSTEGLDADVLKVGHHGSKTSSSELLVGYTSPEYAVISVGADNKYGHPNQEVLDILNKFGIKILRTDESGTIKIKTDGESIGVN